jgi:hypothetical protein
MCDFWGLMAVIVFVVALVKGLVTNDGNTVVGGAFAGGFILWLGC